MVHVVPSFEPCTIQFFGSRSGASLAEVSEYDATCTACERSYVSQAVDAKTNHFVPASPSAARIAASPGAFSPLVVTVVTDGSTLPLSGPCTCCCTGAPSRSSTRFAKGFSDSSGSNEVVKSDASAAYAADAAPSGSRPPTTSAVPASTASDRLN